MKKTPLVAALALALSAPAMTRAQVVTEMTPDLVKQAIADGKTRGCYPLGKTGSLGSEAFDLGCFTTPYSRVVQAAQAAKRKYKPFTEADVTPDMLEPRVEVVGFPQPKKVYGSDRHAGRASVEAIVITPKKSKDRSAAVVGQFDPSRPLTKRR